MDAIALDQKVIATLENCITKIADRLNKTFDVNDPQSVSLLKLFCSSVKIRLTFFKNIAKNKEKTINKVEKIKKQIDAKIVTEPVLSFTPPQKTGREYQHPLRPQDLQSRLLLKKE
jgi:hypothetical protein